MIKDISYKQDYLSMKLDNKSNLDAQTGATESDKFNALPSDDDRYEVITFNNVTGGVAVPFLMVTYTLTQPEAEQLYASLVLKSIELNAKACKSRFENKAGGWWPILFAYFTQDTAQSIIDAVRDYMSDYVNYAKFGMNYGDAELGLFDFIDNTNGVITSLEDYPLISGSDYSAVQTALKTYFRG